MEEEKINMVKFKHERRKKDEPQKLHTDLQALSA